MLASWAPRGVIAALSVFEDHTWWFIWGVNAAYFQVFVGIKILALLTTNKMPPPSKNPCPPLTMTACGRPNRMRSTRKYPRFSKYHHTKRVNPSYLLVCVGRVWTLIKTALRHDTNESQFTEAISHGRHNPYWCRYVLRIIQRINLFSSVRLKCLKIEKTNLNVFNVGKNVILQPKTIDQKEKQHK